MEMLRYNFTDRIVSGSLYVLCVMTNHIEISIYKLHRDNIFSQFLS